MMKILVATGLGATICIFIYTLICHRRANELLPEGYQLKGILPSSITIYAPAAMFIAPLVVGSMWFGLWKFKW